MPKRRKARHTRPKPDPVPLPRPEPRKCDSYDFQDWALI